MPNYFLMSNQDGTTERALIIESIRMQTPAGLVDFVTHAMPQAEGACQMKKISHYRSGMAITTVPSVVNVEGCIRALETAFAAHAPAKIKQRLLEPITLNPEVEPPEAPPSQPQKENTMSLEQALIENTAAMAALTAALLAKAAPAAAAPAAAEKQAEPAKEKPAKTKKEEAKAETKPAEPEVKELTLEDIKPIAVKLAAEKGRDVLTAVLQRLGVPGDSPKTSGLKTSQYAEFIDLANKTLAGEYDPIASDADEDL